MTNFIDAKGKACPIPVVLARQAITAGADALTIEVDNATAVENLKRLAAAEAAAIAEHYGLKKTADEPQRAETVCYHLLSDVPQGDYRTVLDKLIAADILRGRSGTGEERVLDLTEDSVRLLVLLDRAGAFGS